MNDRTESLLLALPGLLLLVLAFFLPIGQMLVLSISGPDGPTLSHFARFLSDPFYLGILWRTVRLSLLITVICALIGFPLAYIMARVGPRLRLWLVVMVILPLMTSVVVRTFGWMVLLSRSGLIPELLRDMGLVGRSFALMQTEAAIVIGMVQVLLPFMTLSILGVITRIDGRLEEAARTMGCSFLQSFRTVVLPLSLPGIVAGSLLCFTLSTSLVCDAQSARRHANTSVGGIDLQIGYPNAGLAVCCSTGGHIIRWHPAGTGALYQDDGLQQWLSQSRHGCVRLP
ncbi:ABC transporter permease [Devosia algicola]|uniref:ABC transporter permease n=1 Tax=Devosia algicola TaxID=3026418 RepID=A0ABY7YK17_9HYPH|nr:ABC transporter permease [Devosia algicola]WDR01532.1 ABC transporter permease [Devosia algicola]